jgi:hypothetical protein
MPLIWFSFGPLFFYKKNYFIGALDGTPRVGVGGAKGSNSKVTALL